MKRHATTDELADLAEGTLRRRKAAKISAHVTICVQCTSVSGQLASVSGLLASVQFAPMPEQYSVRIEAAIAVESAHRVALEPATEADRRDLPVKGRSRPQREHGWHILGLSRTASRLVSAAGALVLIGVGSYEIASNVGSTANAPSSTSGASAALPNAGKVTFGPNVSYHQNGEKSIRTVSTEMNFIPSKLGKQAVSALATARLNGAIPGGSAPAVQPTPSANHVSHAVKQTRTSDPQLSGCVDRIAAGKAVLLVEFAKFEGKPATIVITAAAQRGSGEVWVVGPTCSASNTEVLDHLKVAHT